MILITSTFLLSSTEIDYIWEWQWIVLLLITCKCNYSYCLWCELTAWGNQTVPGNQYALIRMTTISSLVQERENIISRWLLSEIDSNTHFLPCPKVSLALNHYKFKVSLPYQNYTEHYYKWLFRLSNIIWICRVVPKCFDKYMHSRGMRQQLWLPS